MRIWVKFKCLHQSFSSPPTAERDLAEAKVSAEPFLGMTFNPFFPPEFACSLLKRFCTASPRPWDEGHTTLTCTSSTDHSWVHLHCATLTDFHCTQSHERHKCSMSMRFFSVEARIEDEWSSTHRLSHHKRVQRHSRDSPVYRVGRENVHDFTVQASRQEPHTHGEKYRAFRVNSTFYCVTYDCNLSMWTWPISERKKSLFCTALSITKTYLPTWRTKSFGRFSCWTDHPPTWSPDSTFHVPSSP